MILWKKIWGYLLSDVEFRRYFSGARGDYDLSQPIRITRKKGTLYKCTSDDECHFVGYEIIDGQMYIFNSAKPGTRYGSSILLDGANIIPCHPQLDQEDTFCQTWSLAWLSPKFRKYTLAKDPSLFGLCKMIARTHEFSNFIKANREVIDSWIHDEGSDLDSDWFFDTSINMTLQEFKTLFN
jgi:hypothetical protein